MLALQALTVVTQHLANDCVTYLLSLVCKQFPRPKGHFIRARAKSSRPPIVDVIWLPSLQTNCDKMTCWCLDVINIYPQWSRRIKDGYLSGYLAICLQYHAVCWAVIKVGN